MMRSRIDREGFVRIGEDFRRGEVVVIRDGPFRNIQAVFERYMNDRERVMVLLNSLNYQAQVEVERSQLMRPDTVSCGASPIEHGLSRGLLNR